jgi:hypothetical protein
MLAGTVVALAERGLGPPPKVHAETAVDLVLTLEALGHARLLLVLRQ